MQGKRVLVTGGAGFIGSHLVDALIERGAQVAVLDDLATGYKQNLNPEATFHYGSIEDTEIVRTSLRNADVVYHLAADATTRESSMGWDTPIETLKVNTIGTLKLFKLIVDVGRNVRVVFASSAAVYGEPTMVPINEDHPTNPISPYGISKLAGEKFALAYCKEFGTDSVIVRIFNTYGPRQPRYVIFDLLKKLQTNPTQLEVLGTPNIVRDYCYVSDTVNALLLAADEGIAGEIYNVSGGNSINIGTLVQLILSELHLTNVHVHFSGHSWKGDIVKMMGDCSKIRRIGFKPEITIECGLKLMLESTWWTSKTWMKTDN